MLALQEWESEHKEPVWRHYDGKVETGGSLGGQSVSLAYSVSFSEGTDSEK